MTSRESESLLIARCAKSALFAYAPRMDSAHVPGLERMHWEWANSQGSLLFSPETLTGTLAIAGTDDPVDVALDCNVRTITLSNGLEVHRGFLFWARNIIAGLKSDHALWQTLLGLKSVVITGHSAGGACAILLPILLPEVNWERIVTFGCPRVLRAKTAGEYQFAGKLLRVERPLDLIPDVPLHVTGSWSYRRLSGWTHVGRSVVYHDNGTIDFEKGLAYEIWRRWKRFISIGWRACLYGPKSWSQVRAVACQWHSVDTYRQLCEMGAAQ